MDGITKLKSQLISKTEKKQRITLASTIPDDYNNPWQTIRRFNPKNHTGQTDEIENQTLKNFINKTSDDIQKILPLLKQKSRDNLTKQERIALKKTHRKRPN